MLIFRRSNCISTASGIVTLFRWLFSTQVTRVTCVLTQSSFCQMVESPDTYLGFKTWFMTYFVIVYQNYII